MKLGARTERFGAPCVAVTASSFSAPDVISYDFELRAVALVDRTEPISCGRRLGATVSRCYRPNKELSLTAPAALTG